MDKQSDLDLDDLPDEAAEMVQKYRRLARELSEVGEGTENSGERSKKLTRLAEVYARMKGKYNLRFDPPTPEFPDFR